MAKAASTIAAERYRQQQADLMDPEKEIDEPKLVAAMLRGIRACRSRADCMAFARQPESRRVYAHISETGKNEIKAALKARADECDAS
jgi:hypothetical protein